MNPRRHPYNISFCVALNPGVTMTWNMSAHPDLVTKNTVNCDRWRDNFLGYLVEPRTEIGYAKTLVREINSATPVKKEGPPLPDHTLSLHMLVPEDSRPEAIVSRELGELIMQAICVYGFDINRLLAYVVFNEHLFLQNLEQHMLCRVGFDSVCTADCTAEEIKKVFATNDLKTINRFVFHKNKETHQRAQSINGLSIFPAVITNEVVEYIGNPSVSLDLFPPEAKEPRKRPRLL